MPSARIKTLAVEDAHSLAEDLRTRGFAVEIVPPDKVSSEPVDLEVVLEECDPEAALHHAENVPEAHDLCVFVAPGALTEGQRPMKVVPLFSESSTAAPVAKLMAMPATLAEPVKLEKEEVLEEKEALEEPAALEEPEKFVPATPPPVIAAKPVEAPSQPEATEVPTISPEVWTVRPAEPVRKPAVSALAKTGKSLSGWAKRVAANQRVLQRTATVAAMGAVAAVSVLVLGSTIRRFSPLPTDAQPASATMVLPATTSASSTIPEPQETKPRLMTPVPPPALTPQAKSTRVHNPEEDIVAKDYVIHFSQRPATAHAKKTSGVKRYSDLR